MTNKSSKDMASRYLAGRRSHGWPRNLSADVGRHANAALLNVSFSTIPGAVRVDVHDDGKSFQVDKTLACRTNKRLGLLGMRQRVKRVGSTLNVAPDLGCGTLVRVNMPFASTLS